MTPEPWELSDEQIWAEVDYALVSKWMLSSERRERNRQERDRQQALLERDPARRRRLQEALWRAAQGFAEMWRDIVFTYEVQPTIGEVLRDLITPAQPKQQTLPGAGRSRQTRAELRPVRAACPLPARPQLPVPARPHRRQHR